MDLFQAMRERRSIRKYEERPVEKEKLDLILEMARLAPSWKNMQCWRFLVIDQAERKQAMLDAFPDDNPGKKALTQAPIVIVVCANPNESGIEEGKEYYLADSAIAFEHICLSATALGLGTCWMGWFDEAVLKQSLGIPSEFKVIGLTPLGYPAQSPNPRPRKQIREIAFLNKWGNSYE